jgi:UDP-N-acetylmuramoyl-tripeptide--D-alanyl-D-alanine ligase
MKEAAARERDWSRMGWTRQEVLTATGAVAGAEPARDETFEAVCIDSRRVTPGSLFVALRGEHHDAHRFVADALRTGARAALVERVPPDVDPRRALVVADALRGLGDLAAAARRRQPVRVVGITGSNGKTTTKEMVANICREARFPPPRAAVLSTHGNENNLVGLPLTLLRLTGDEAVAVLEMGMNAPGEIARLTEIAAPDVGVITNVGPAHLEGLGSIDGVAAAKGELFAGMAREAIVAVNMEDERVVRAAAAFPGRRIEFGAGGQVTARSVRDLGVDGVAFELDVAGRAVSVRLRVPGRHNVANALAAAAVAHGLGLDVDAIAAGLAQTPPPAMRMQVVRLANGVTVVNDAYNANPASMEAGLRALAAMPGRALAVLGEMRELGPESDVLHEALGARAAASGIAALVAVGPQSECIAAGARAAGGRLQVRVCADAAAAAAAVESLWRPGDVILVKGSRGSDAEKGVREFGARMAEVVALLERAGGRP